MNIRKNTGTRREPGKAVWIASLASLGMIVLLVNGCATAPDVELPRAINAPILDYPPDAILNRESGELVVLLYVDADGSADSWQIKRSTGVPILDETGMGFVKSLEFLPLVANGRTQACWAEQEVIFSLTKPALKPEEWRRTTRSLIKQLDDADPAEQEDLRQRLYGKYTDYMSSVITHQDLALNRIAMKLVVQPLRDKWARYTNTSPMSFLMFADYVARIKESPYHERALAQLKRSVEVDILVIEKRLRSREDPALLQMRESLLAYLSELQ